MNRRSIVGAATLAAACAIVLAGCSDASAQQRLVEAIEASPTHEVKLATALGLRSEPEQYIVACPYEPREQVQSALGFEWAGAPDYALDDSYQSVIFVVGGSVSESFQFAVSTSTCARLDTASSLRPTPFDSSRSVDPGRCRTTRTS